MEGVPSKEGGGDSSCSTPYYSAPSSPVRVGNPGCYFSAPASPMHFLLSAIPVAKAVCDSRDDFGGGQASCDFEFSARFTCPGGAAAVGSMMSADELFLNGQIRPMKLSTHLQRPQVLPPLLDVGEGKHQEEVVRGRESRLRCGSLHRRARSMSPLRTTPTRWTEDDEEKHDGGRGAGNLKIGCDGPKEKDEMQSTACASASSTGRNGRRWVFLKDFLYRSKSEGRGNGKDKFWQSTSIHQSKDTLKRKYKAVRKKQKEATSAAKKASAAASTASKPGVGVGKRRMPPCERHYTANRSQAEEMRKRTFLPYRQGLLGCLGFTSRGYSAVNGLAGTLTPLSSR